VATTAKPPPVPAVAQDASGRLRNAGDELLEACTALEAEVEELKARYEMYFLGVERLEPNRWRDEVKKKVLRLKETFTRNTGLRFRLQTLHARFISYERLWLRSSREREEGTYRRDIFKARLHSRAKAGAGAAARPAPAPGADHGHAHHEGEDVDLSDFHDAPPAAAAPTPPQTPAPARPAASVVAAVGAKVAPPASASAVARPAAAKPAAPPPPPPAPSPAAGGKLADAQMRELYDAYISAKKRCNEDVSRLTYDAVANSVSKQIPEIIKQHKAKAVEFKVVIKDGKAKLTAVPKT
jgi:hypothetical protein